MSSKLKITQVSIPFKRESGSKEQARGHRRWRIWSFNSLQTGKRIQSGSNGGNNGGTKTFQFPSNGKAYPKTIPKTLRNSCIESFNSLQTGKPIQSNADRIPPHTHRHKSFNSLQTGKRIQREWAVLLEKALDSFNSLQTGKRIQRKVG